MNTQQSTLSTKIASFSLLKNDSGYPKRLQQSQNKINKPDDLVETGIFHFKSIILIAGLIFCITTRAQDHYDQILYDLKTFNDDIKVSENDSFIINYINCQNEHNHLGLISIPDLSNNENLEAVLIDRNQYSSEDIEPVLNDYVNAIGGNFIYSPQNTVDPAQTITSGVGVDITLTVTAADGLKNNSSNSLFQSFKNDIAIPDAFAPTLIISNAQESDSGIYHCEIRNSIVPDLTILREPINVTIDATLGTDDLESLHFKLYPNPSQNWIYMRSGSNLLGSEILIKDINGRVISSQRLETNNTGINIENLSNGVYLLSVKNGQKEVVQRFIKQ